MPDVSTPSAAYDTAESRRALCRDLFGGTSAMRAGTTSYLLKFDSEDQADYQVRLNDSFLTPFFAEAVHGVVGRMFAEPLILSDDTPDRVRALWDDIDLNATQADVFLYGVEIDAVRDGISWVLVDMPPNAEGRQRTAGEEARDGVRPFWKQYDAGAVVEPPLVIFDSGIPRIQRMRVKVTATEADGEWGTKEVNRIIVYRRGNPSIPDPGANAFPGDPMLARFSSFETHEAFKGEDGKERWAIRPDLSGRFLPPRSASPDLRRRFVNLPLVPFITQESGHFQGDPPLRDGLAELCLQHWRKKSRLDVMDDAVNVPIFTAMMSRADFEGANYIASDTTKTYDQRELRIGPYTMLFTGGDGRDIKWLEHTGRSIDSAETRLQKLEDQIQQAANDPFVRRPTAVSATSTATAAILSDQKPRTQAQIWAVAAESAIDECLEWTSAWLGLDQVGSVTFGKSAMDSLGTRADFGQVLEMFKAGQITQEQLLHEAKRYGLLDPDSQDVAPAQPESAPQPAEAVNA